MDLTSWFKKELDKRKEDHSFRTLKPQGLGIDFSSNDYLGLARSHELFQRIEEGIQTIVSPLNGATGSRLLTGNSELAEETEAYLANLFHSERCLLFNSGYNANLGVLSSIPQRGDTILYDELSHACIKDGARLSLANRFSFLHNDLDDLERKIKKSSGKIFIAVESVYSMDGDQCPLKELVAMANHYEASIILDEAHSTGIFGEDGNGLACSLGLESEIAIRIYTFGKAMGVHGAVVAGSTNLVNYLINYSRPFIYTTALPPHSLIAIKESFKHISAHSDIQEKLHGKMNLFNSHSGSSTTKNQSPIQSVIVPGNETVRNLSAQLLQEGFDCRPILSPTVKEGKERIRICLHTYNEDHEIQSLITYLAKIKELKLSS